MLSSSLEAITKNLTNHHQDLFDWDPGDGIKIEAIGLTEIPPSDYNMPGIRQRVLVHIPTSRRTLNFFAHDDWSRPINSFISIPLPYISISVETLINPSRGGFYIASRIVGIGMRTIDDPLGPIAGSFLPNAWKNPCTGYRYEHHHSSFDSKSNLDIIEKVLSQWLNSKFNSDHFDMCYETPILFHLLKLFPDNLPWSSTKFHESILLSKKIKHSTSVFSSGLYHCTSTFKNYILGLHWLSAQDDNIWLDKVGKSCEHPYSLNSIFKDEKFVVRTKFNPTKKSRIFSKLGGKS